MTLLLASPVLAQTPWVAPAPEKAKKNPVSGQDQSDGELFWKISSGRGAMPSWRQLPERERWAVLRFIRTLNK